METINSSQENLNEKESPKEQKQKMIIVFSILSSLIVIAVIIIIIVVIIKNKDNDSKDSNDSDCPYKPTLVKTVKIPDNIIYDSHAIYSKTGRIIFQYKKENDTKTYIGIMDDDGSNFTTIWSGEWKQYYKNSGIRLMPFIDNKKILTGDYVLECMPNLDNCQNYSLLPIIYPEEVQNLIGLNKIWSEIVISPDEHIGWTSLSSVYQSVNFIAKLNKNEDKNYTMTNVQVISTLNFMEYEEGEEEILKKIDIRGGEMKQFIKGGEALTLAGAGDGSLAKSVFQNLVGKESYPITHYPGYEETTIISPDGKLGLVMTTRFSPKTSSAIIDFVPRPLSILTSGNMNMYAYMYAVPSVRQFREGNIGPAVIDIEESIKNPSHIGYDLHEDGWVFCSPLSWHPNSKRGMFSEISRKEKTKRIRIVYFDDYKPGKIEENKKTPDDISYAKTLDDIKGDFNLISNGYYKGKSGIMIVNRTQASSKSEYIEYSEDGKTFYNGYEKFEYLDSNTGRLESNIIVTGENTGKMELNLTMNLEGKIIYEKDGKNMSSGYAEYNGKKLTIEEAYDKDQNDVYK